jgi:hypothetical protein
MAKIPVEKETGGGGWWKWLLGLLLLGLIIWIIWGLVDDDDMEVGENAEPNVENVTPEGNVTAETTPERIAEGSAAITVGDILSNPDQRLGETYPRAEVTVAEGRQITDRGFWIQDQGEYLFAIIIDRPQEQPKDINPGATLRIEEATLRDRTYLPEMPGRPLDQQTENIAEQQDVFLVVDERYINILEQGTPQPGTDPAQNVQ